MLAKGMLESTNMSLAALQQPNHNDLSLTCAAQEEYRKNTDFCVFRRLCKECGFHHLRKECELELFHHRVN